MENSPAQASTFHISKQIYLQMGPLWNNLMNNTPDLYNGCLPLI